MNNNVVKEIKLIAELPPTELFKEISYWEAYEKHTPLWNLMSKVGGSQNQNNQLYPGMRMVCKGKKTPAVQGYLLGFDNQSKDPMVFIVPAKNPTVDQFPHAEWMDVKPWYSQKQTMGTTPCMSVPYIYTMMVFYAGIENSPDGVKPAPIMPDLYNIPDGAGAPPAVATAQPISFAPINNAPAPIMQFPAGSIPKQIIGQLEDHISKLSTEQKVPINEIIAKLMDKKFNDVDAVCEFGQRKLKKMPKTLEVEEIRQFFYRLGLYLLKDNPTDAIKYLLEDEVTK